MKLTSPAKLQLVIALTLHTGVLRTAALAQTVQTAVFTGMIRNAGAGVPGADVRLRPLASGRDIVASTNPQGRFVFTNVQPGDALLIAIHGKKTATRFVRLKAGDNAADLALDEQAPPAATGSISDNEIVVEYTQGDETHQRQRKVDEQGEGGASPQITAPSVSYEAAGTKEEVAASATPTKTATPAPATATPAPIAAPAYVSPLCDPKFRGEPVEFEFKSAVSFGRLVDQLNSEFGARILLDNDVQQLPVQVTLSDGPWTSVLRSLLVLNDLDTICLDDGLVAIGKRTKIQQIQEQRRLSAPLVTDYIEVKNLQTAEGSPVDPSGQPQGTAGSTLDTLETQVRELLRAADKRAEFRRVPGTNIFYIAATPEQIDRAKELIALADRPPYQVYMEALMYTVNNTQRKALGGELAVVVGNGAGTNLGGFTTMPNNRGTGSGNNGSGTSGINPGGIPGLGTGFTQPTGLTAPNPTITIGATGVFGTAQFSAQYTAAQFRGLLNEQARPNGIVMSGQTFRIDSGLQIPITIPAIVNGGTTGGQLRFLEAGIIGNITPFVSPDGKTITVRVRLEKNSVDTSVAGEGGNPGINRNSAQTMFQIPDGVTVVLGGLSTDSLSDALTKTPFLADIPGLGELFKKKEKNEIRTVFYYAIRFRIIPRGQPFPQPELPSDAKTDTVPAPDPQRLSPYGTEGESKRRP
jgi:type II secretory pathway component GspD/PulD (secretin)